LISIFEKARDWGWRLSWWRGKSCWRGRTRRYFCWISGAAFCVLGEARSKRSFPVLLLNRLIFRFARYCLEEEDEEEKDEEEEMVVNGGEGRGMVWSKTETCLLFVVVVGATLRKSCPRGETKSDVKLVTLVDKSKELTN
jgi:hypothetical protein